MERNLNSLETDPKVGTLSVNKIPKWNGSSLTDGIMHDNGSKIGIGTADPLHAFHVHNGNFYGYRWHFPLEVR